MNKRTLTTGFVVSAIFAVSIVGAGCKKEDPKVETLTPASTQETAAPQATAGGVFKAEILPESVPQTVKKGSKLALNVKVKNTSGQVWPAKEPNPVRLSYHWRDSKSNKPVVWDGKRTSLSADLAVGQDAVLAAKIDTPAQAGSYIFELDMVQEKVSWFSKKGSAVSTHTIEVK